MKFDEDKVSSLYINQFQAKIDTKEKNFEENDLWSCFKYISSNIYLKSSIFLDKNKLHFAEYEFVNKSKSLLV